MNHFLVYLSFNGQVDFWDKVIKVDAHVMEEAIEKVRELHSSYVIIQIKQVRNYG